MSDWFHALVGASADTIVWWQMAIRAVFIFFAALVFVRFGGKRVFGKHTSFDIVLSVILGSNMSRALTGNAPFLATVAASAAIVVLHMILAKTAFHSDVVGHLIKGHEDRLVDSGDIRWPQMRKNNLTERDLMEGLRDTGVDRLESVRAAYIERGGQISVIRAGRP